MRLFCLLLWCVFVSFIATSQNIITDRPDQSESPSTIDPGFFQIETGLLINSSHASQNLCLPSTLFRIGLLNNLEFRVFNQLEHKLSHQNSPLTTKFNFSDLEFGFKLQLLKSVDIKTEVAILSHLAIPSTNWKGMNLGLINKLCVSHSLSDRFSVGYNLGYNYYDFNVNDRSGSITYSLVFGVEVIKKINAYLEPYGETGDNSDAPSNINMGITYLYRDHIQFDYSFGTGLDSQFNFISLGCSILLSQ